MIDMTGAIKRRRCAFREWSIKRIDREIRLITPLHAAAKSGAWGPSLKFMAAGYKDLLNRLNRQRQRKMRAAL